LALNWLVSSIISPYWVAFSVIHLLIVPFLKDRKDWLWFLLTWTHGMAHILHPAFFGIIYNDSYTPYWDFIVHSASMMCIHAYHKEFAPVGTFLAMTMMNGGLLAHLYPPFMGEPIWLAFSFVGIVGAVYHMMLLNKEKDPKVFIATCILWILPYLGYIQGFTMIPYWDSFVSKLGLFNLWFFTYFFTMKVYRFTEKKFALGIRP